MMEVEMPRGIYVHIPFCTSKCIYCAFYSIPVGKGDMQLYNNYIDAVLLEADMSSEFTNGTAFSTIYIGGGTPTKLPPEIFEKLVRGLKNKFVFKNNIEFTVEANPESLSAEFLETARDLGVNRLSIGAQYGSDDVLKFLGRLHSVKDVERGVELARNLGIENINLDLIFGLPDETVGMWRSTLEWAAALGPTHISTYSLTVEENTKLKMLINKGLISLPEVDKLVQLFEIREEVLEEHGYKRYEISNFAIPGFESRHNLIYWKWQKYLGLGASAASFWIIDYELWRWTNIRSVREYIRRLFDNVLPREFEENLDDNMARLEKVFLGLRLSEGLDVGDEIIAGAIKNEFPEFVEIEGTKVKLTFKGMLVADHLAIDISEFLENPD